MDSHRPGGSQPSAAKSPWRPVAGTGCHRPRRLPRLSSPLLLRRGLGVVSPARRHTFTYACRRPSSELGLDWLRGQPARSAADVGCPPRRTPGQRGPADSTSWRTHYRGAAQRMLVNAGAAMKGVQAWRPSAATTIEGVTITARADHIQTAGRRCRHPANEGWEACQERRKAEGPLCAATSHGEARRRGGRQLLAYLSPRWQPATHGRRQPN